MKFEVKTADIIRQSGLDPDNHYSVVRIARLRKKLLRKDQDWRYGPNGCEYTADGAKRICNELKGRG